MKEIIQKAIEFGIKQERERAEFMAEAAYITFKPSPAKFGPAVAVAIPGVGLRPLDPPIKAPKAAKAPKPPKAAKAARRPRQTGVMKAVKGALATDARMTLAELVSETGAKEGTVRAALRTLTGKGVATVTAGKWHSAEPATAGNSVDHSEAA